MASTLTIPVADTPSQLTPAEIAEIIRSQKLIEDWLKMVGEHARGLLAADPASIPGVQLARGVRRREWADENAAVKAMLALGLNDMHKPVVLKSVADVEKAAGEDAIAKLEGTAWEYVEGKPRLVPTAAGAVAAAAAAPVVVRTGASGTDNW